MKKLPTKILIVDDEPYDGLKLTGYFLEHWVFNHHTRGVPQSRLLFEVRFAKSMERDNLENVREAAT